MYNEFKGKCHECGAKVNPHCGYITKALNRYVLWCEAHAPASVFAVTPPHPTLKTGDTVEWIGRDGLYTLDSYVNQATHWATVTDERGVTWHPVPVDHLRAIGSEAVA